MPAYRRAALRLLLALMGTPQRARQSTYSGPTLACRGDNLLPPQQPICCTKLAAPTHSRRRANKEPWRRCLEEPAEVGPCRGRVERWTFDPTSATCVKFYWGGCQGSRNRFNTKRACEQKCRLK